MRRLVAWMMFLCVAALPASAQVSVEASIDSLQIMIGEQARITLEVSMGAGGSIAFPAYPDTLVAGVEVLEASVPDTTYINDNKRMLVKEVYTITSFDSALYYLPPMPVVVNNDTCRSQALALKVYSVPVDTEHPDQFFGPKDAMRPDFAWSDWLAAIVCVLLWGPLVYLFVYLLKRLKDNKPIIRRVKVTPEVPPHLQAMGEIERIKAEKMWQKGLSKEYYTQLTDVLRTYLFRRFGFNAMEMTTDEILEHLERAGEAKKELQQLLQTADLVKFAKFIPLMNENDMNLLNAVRFVEETKVAEEEGSREPKEITIVEKRPLRTKVLLLTGMGLIGLFVAGSLIYVIVEWYNYCM